MTDPHRNIRLEEALALSGCPVCRMVVQRVAQSIRSIENELVLDPGYREKIDSAWGFCNEHAQLWMEQAQPLSTAIIYEAVLGRVSRQMDQRSPGKGGMGGLRSKFSSGRDCIALVEASVCPLCRIREEQEREIVAHFLFELQQPLFQQHYAESDGLCVVHLNLALCASPAPAAMRVLRSRLDQRHEELRSHLREVIRKHDYRFSDEVAGPEWEAIASSVRQIAGTPGIDGRRNRS